MLCAPIDHRRSAFAAIAAKYGQPGQVCQQQCVSPVRVSLPPPAFGTNTDVARGNSISGCRQRPPDIYIFCVHPAADRLHIGFAGPAADNGGLYVFQPTRSITGTWYGEAAAIEFARGKRGKGNPKPPSTGCACPGSYKLGRRASRRRKPGESTWLSSWCEKIEASGLVDYR